MEQGNSSIVTLQLHLAQILVEARSRWLRTREICDILHNHEVFNVDADPPCRPPGGSVFLFNRKALRYFRKDGHRWRMKNDGKSVREAHERLKSDNEDVLQCYYSHGEDDENFQRRIYWLLDKQFEHIVFVHYRDLNQGSCSSAPSLRMADQVIDHALRTQNVPSFCSAIMNSSSFTTQPSYQSSLSIADLNGQTLPSGCEDANLVNCFGGSFCVDSSSCSRFGFAYLPTNNMDKNTIAGCSSSVSHGSSSEFIDSGGMGSLCNCYSNQLDQKAPVLSEDQHIIYGASKESGLYGGTSSEHQNTMPAWSEPETLNLNQRIANLQEQKLLLRQPNYWDCITQNMADSRLEASELINYGVDGRYNIPPNAHLQGLTEAGKKLVQVPSNMTDHSRIKWYCMFSERYISAKLVAPNTLCCQAPMHLSGQVFYITCGDRKPSSEVQKFEFLENLSNATLSMSLKSETKDEISLQKCFVKMLSLGMDKKRPVCSDNVCHKCKLNNKLFSSLNDDKSEWDNIEINSDHWNDVLDQKLLKDTLTEWLLCKIHEEGKGPNILDEEGQGVIHLAAALGYDWASSPVVAAGVSPSSRGQHILAGLAFLTLW